MQIRIGDSEALDTDFSGFIDEVRIYSQVLTTGEIQKHYVLGLEKHKNLVIK